MVMQFWTKYAFAECQQYINTTIRWALDDIRLAYLENILIYSIVQEEHIEHIELVMKCLLTLGYVSHWRNSNSTVKK